MKFCEYPNQWSLFKNSGLARELGCETREDMYRALLNISPDCHLGIASMSVRHAYFDTNWNDIGCPYYDVYPKIIPMLTKLNLDIPGDQIKPPNGLENLLLRLPENTEHSLSRGDMKVKSIFMSFQKCSRSVGSLEKSPALVVGLDLGERDESGLLPMFTMRVFPIDERNIEESMNTLIDFQGECDGWVIPNDLIDDCVRLCLTVCLIGDNSEVLQPQVLTNDMTKYNIADEITKRKLIDKAKRRGKFGFSLGAGIEKAPHYRIPHKALIRVGEGRRQYKLIFRSGSLVHRNKVEQIPTGYLNEQ